MVSLQHKCIKGTIVEQLMEVEVLLMKVNEFTEFLI